LLALCEVPPQQLLIPQKLSVLLKIVQFNVFDIEKRTHWFSKQFWYDFIFFSFREWRNLKYGPAHILTCQQMLVASSLVAIIHSLSQAQSLQVAAKNQFASLMRVWAASWFVPAD